MKAVIKQFLKDWAARGWFLVNMLCTIIYLIWRIFFTIPYGYGIISIIIGVWLLVIEVLGMVEAFVHYINMYNAVSYPLPDVPESEFPDVDIFVSTYSESPDLLRKTLLGCKRMDYPDKRKVHIYLCDDAHRDEMRVLAEEVGVNYLCRDTHEGAKAGNLNHALDCSSSPYIVTFDADMIPQSCFLMKSMPYFVDAELRNRGLKEEDRIELGLLQTPQSFYDLDLYQFNLFSERRIPNEQDYFYRDIQVARTRSNSVLYGGSNTIISRKALRDIGGFYTGTITEDFATGILIEEKGYVSLATGEPLASGMNTNTLQSMIQQRIRWARGVISTGKRMHVLTTPNLTFAQKMNYWASVWYWYAPVKRLIYILAPMMYATFGFMVFKCTLPQVLLFWLPMYVSSNISLRALSRNIRTTKWTAIYETALFPYMLIPILLETFGITLRKFKVTNKNRDASASGRSIIYMIPFLILIVLSVIGIFNCVRLMFSSGTFGPIVVLFWLVNNLFMLVMSLFFVDGRAMYRSAERINIQIPITLHTRGESYAGITKDLSENGVCLDIQDPHYVADDEPAQLEIQTERYHVLIDLKVVYATQVNYDGEERWRYAFSITDFRDSYDHYLGVLYDRPPALPDRIANDSGAYDDLWQNLSNRMKTPFREKRQFPRIPVDADVADPESGEVYRLHDFNYVCAAFSGSDLPEELRFSLPCGCIIECKYDRDVLGYCLYNVTNASMLYASQETCDRIMADLLLLAEEAKAHPTQEPALSDIQPANRGAKEFDEIERML